MVNRIHVLCFIYLISESKSMETQKQRNYLFWKRAIDIFGSFVGLVVLFPFLLFCTLITFFVSKGSPFFIQERLGKKKRIFKMIKFRSMKRGSEEVACEDLGEKQQHDMTTSWGRFIRKTSLDETPQLLNILVGNMSFVGPRPSLINKYEQNLITMRESFIPNPYDVKPGLTGYAQVILKKGHNISQKARLDSFYVQHMSFWLDAKIFFLSLFLPFVR